MNNTQHVKNAHEGEYPVNEVAQSLLGETYAEDLIFLYLKGMGQSKIDDVIAYLENLNLACVEVGVAQSLLAGLIEFVPVKGEVGFKAAQTSAKIERNRRQLANARLRMKLAGL